MGVGVTDGVPVPLKVGREVTEGVADMDPVLLGDTPAGRLGVGLPDRVALLVGVLVRVVVPVAEGVVVETGVGVPVKVPVPVGL